RRLRRLSSTVATRESTMLQFISVQPFGEGIVVFPLAFPGLNAVLYPPAEIVLLRKPSCNCFSSSSASRRLYIGRRLLEPHVPVFAGGIGKTLWSACGDRENEGSSRSGRGAGKRLYGCRFVIDNVKNGVELGDLQYVMNFIVQVQEL